MSDEIKYIDADSEDFEDAPRALRDAYKKLVSAHKQVTKDLTETRTTMASRAVADVLADKGFKNPERVKRDLLADGIDPLDNSAVDGWLASNGDDYAKAAPEAGESQQQEQQSAAVSDEVAQQYQKLQVSGEPAVNDKWQRAQAEITPEMDGAAVRAVYAKHGI